MTQSKERESRERILAAALTLFARYGLEKTTIADIASRAHLSKATLYHHFPDGKASIFEHAIAGVIEAAWGGLETQVRAAGPSPLAQLLTYVTLRIEVFDREIMVRGVAKEVWGDLKPWIETALVSAFERERGLIVELLEAAIEADEVRELDTDVTARFLQASLRGLTFEGPIETTGTQRKRDTEQVLTFIQLGLGAAPR